MPLVRLDKILTDTGLCSRSQAREIIRRGRAAVNGTPCADPAAKFDPEAVSPLTASRSTGRDISISCSISRPAC